MEIANTIKIAWRHIELTSHNGTSTVAHAHRSIMSCPKSPHTAILCKVFRRDMKLNGGLYVLGVTVDSQLNMSQEGQQHPGLYQD